MRKIYSEFSIIIPDLQIITSESGVIFMDKNNNQNKNNQNQNQNKNNEQNKNNYENDQNKKDDNKNF